MYKWKLNTRARVRSHMRWTDQIKVALYDDIHECTKKTAGGRRGMGTDFETSH